MVYISAIDISGLVLQQISSIRHWAAPFNHQRSGTASMLPSKINYWRYSYQLTSLSQIHLVKMYVRTMAIYQFVLANLQLAMDSRKSPTSRGEEKRLIEDIILKKKLEIFRFITLSLAVRNFPEKMKLHPSVLEKLYYTPWNLHGQKPRLFFITTGKANSFFTFN